MVCVPLGHSTSSVLETTLTFLFVASRRVGSDGNKSVLIEWQSANERGGERRGCWGNLEKGWASGAIQLDFEQ